MTPLSLSASISISVVLPQMASLGEETGAGHAVGKVKETSTTNKTDLDSKVPKLNAFISCEIQLLPKSHQFMSPEDG
jgi:hypothetical protein